MGMKKLFAFFPFLLLMQNAYAHCPLCTAGAAVAAGGAAWLGISKAAIGIFIGAFAVSTGWWASNLLKRKYIPFQKQLLILFSFVATIIPLMPLMESIYPVYISWAGDYGSLLNRTYILNLFLAGSILGGFIVCITPWLSKKITELQNGKMLPYQGIILTFALLIILSAAIELIL
mgnify:CR=1 FL=1